MAKRAVCGTMPSLLNNSVEDKNFSKIDITTEEFVIGRSLQSSFVIPDPTLSRRHCTFRYSGEQWSVTDESTMGTYVNGLKMTKGSTVILKAGDDIQFGSNSKWKYTFSFLYNHQNSEVLDVKRAKLDSDESITENTPTSIPNGDEDTEKIIAGKVEFEQERDKTSAEFLDKQNSLIDNELEVKKQTDSEQEVKNNRNEFEQQCRILKEQGDLKQLLAQAQKLTEKLKSERANIQAALLERDQQLQNLKKISNQEVLTLKRKLKSMKARLAEKEKQEGENARHLEEVTTRTLRLEEEGKKREENNQMLMESLLRDVDEREEAAKRRLKEALENLHHDKAAIENEIKEKSEAKEDVGKLTEELEKVKQNLIIVDQKREMLEKELSEAVQSASVNTLQAREEILHNFGELMETELQCSICNELFVAATTLTCNHTFCKFCISEWKKKKKDCPVCRKPISAEFRSLSLDNFINKMVENLSDDMKKRRQELKDERQALCDKNKNRNDGASGSRNGIGNGSGERRRVRSTRRTTAESIPRPRRRQPLPAVVESLSPPAEIVTVHLSDSSIDSEEDSEDSSPITSDSSDSSYAEGVTGSFYGGYGNCFHCGRHGHWANGCPDLF
ncbi:E3 ubiquitin-protein ligase rnf8-like isoform X3 [Schistocerca serialis cubense]|uniref:E3 ubiquitin-protein ligase rnf8-like isoform X3 n=1 Tax=Schistocerca serialis cubense TaxID=2023355 RepID=UPI00214E653A|nr:E3 ubiquitin-protein ligase rnf8-like isoform X3 [Schistocerca serialis cubense]